MSTLKCMIKDCEGKSRTLGRCIKHYLRDKRAGILADVKVGVLKGSAFHDFGNLVAIELGNSHNFALVDRNIFEDKGLYKYTFEQNKDGHVKTTIRSKDVFLHQLVLGKKPALVIDHTNLDKLDNRICNLRHVTTQQNSWNRPTEGVQHYPARKSPWRACLKYNGKRVLSKFFKTKEEALSARKEAKEKYFVFGKAL